MYKGTRLVNEEIVVSKPDYHFADAFPFFAFGPFLGFGFSSSSSSESLAFPLPFDGFFGAEVVDARAGWPLQASP